jgi:hypothetical protein
LPTAIAVVLTLVLAAGRAYGQDHNAVVQTDTHNHGEAGPTAGHDGQLGSYPMTREASGTAWQPDSSPVSGVHFGTGQWRLMTDAFVNAVYSDESGPRGDTGRFGTGMLMVMGRRALRTGALGFRLMVTGEPAMGSRGYPLLLQTGESADGRTPLVDRQHPHDMLMELAGTWSRNFRDRSSVFAYVALAGEPPIGPAAFMHRQSAVDDPLAPISHHFLDSSHVSHGVVTVGFAKAEGVKIEAAAFNGHEPDQKRWNIQAPQLNSFAGRLTANPHRDVSLQWSVAHFDQPEQLHVGLDVLLMTASATYNRPLSRGNWQTTLAWGRSKRETPPLPVLSIDQIDSLQSLDIPLGSAHVHVASSGSTGQSPIQRGVLVESSATLRRWHTFFTRFESAGKDELFPPTDARHGTVFVVRRGSIGYVADLPFLGRIRTGIGINASFMSLPSELKTSYGGAPRGIALFLRTRLRS